MIENLWKYYRINNWVKSLGFGLLGITATGLLLSPLLFFCILECSLLLAFLFSFNNFGDYLEENEKNYIGDLIDKSVLPKNLVSFLCFLPLFLSVVLLYSNFSFYHFLLYVLFVFLAFGYSAPKIRLRDIPSMEIICNVSFYCIIFLISYFYINSFLTPKVYFYLIWTIFFCLTSEILHQLSHFEKDKRNKRTTTAILLGKKNAIRFFKLTFIVPIVIGLFIFILSPSLIIYTIVFMISSFLKFIYFKKKMGKKTDFQKLRRSLGGIFEGLIYILLNILKV